MRTKIPGQVYVMGLISFFNDIASEMLYPVMPIFLTQVLGAPVAIVGLIEGCAEAVASFLKTYFGLLSDRIGKRKIFVVGGYSFSVLAKGILALATLWPWVFLGRMVDRLGKGMRMGARDAMLLNYTNSTNKGLIFGLHRSMDSAGAVIGPLVALLLLSWTDENIRLILALSILPGLIGVLLFFFLREVKINLPDKKAINLRNTLAELTPQLKIFLLGVGLFSLGNSSDAFLILKAKDLGMSTTLVITAYVVYNLAYTFLSAPAGWVADKLGSQKVFLAGLLIYALVYFAFAFNVSSTGIFILFGVYGVYIALTDGVSKAILGEITDPNRAGTVYGLYQTITGLMALLASLIGGLLWTYFGSQWTFYFSGTCALLAFFLLCRKLKKA